MKNQSRLSAMMGTWTVNADVRLDIGDYGMETFVVLNFMCDPLKSVNSCEGCSEINNEICLRDDVGSTRCGSMVTDISDWSDGLLYVYFGVRFRAGYPFNTDESFSTGGWVGPYSMIMAQNETATKYDSTLLDSYVLRYVQTPAIPYLRMDPDNNLMNWNDFDSYFGAGAVEYTTHLQNQLNGPNATDPFEKYAGNCDNGSVQPYLPILHFDFLKDKKNGFEKLNVRLDYKVLVFPDSEDTIYSLMPKLQNEGFPFSGPYCYDDDPNRGWTVDVSYDSMEPSLASLVHSCVEGLPCTPPGSDACFTCIEIDTKAPGKATTVHVGSLGLYVFWIACCILAIIYLVVQNLRLSANIKKDLRTKIDSSECSTSLLDNDLNEKIIKI